MRSLGIGIKLNNNRPTAVAAPPGSPTAFITYTGAVGQFGETADDNALDLSGALFVATLVRLDDWTPASAQILASKWDVASAQRSFRLDAATNGRLQFRWSTTGANTITKTSVLHGLADDAASWVGAEIVPDNGASGNDVKFYTSTDGTSWSQLGTTQTTAGVTSVFSSTAPLRAGAQTNPESGNVSGSIRSLVLRDGGLGGVDVANPTFSEANDRSFADAAGRTWSVIGGTYEETA